MSAWHHGIRYRDDPARVVSIVGHVFERAI